MSWQGCNVLVTGGLGFIGSNLVHALVGRGAAVTIVDNLLPGHGGNLFNLVGLPRPVTINYADINDRHAMNHLVRGQQVIFHLAGQVNHVASIEDPFSDLDINARGTLTLLEACRLYNRDVRIVFSGTRGEYGHSVRLPVDEDHPTNPMGIYAVTNLAAEQLLRIYHSVHNIRSMCLRITNTFGPRHQMQHSQYGVVNWFVRLALDGLPVTVMGDGSIKRDLLYIDDLVELLMTAALAQEGWGEIFNVGTGVPTSFLQLAQQVVTLAGRGHVVFVPFSPERKRIEPGDYYANPAKIKAHLGWEARTPLADGLTHTIAFYRENAPHYWEVPHETNGVGYSGRVYDRAVGYQGIAQGLPRPAGAGN
jgi:UDP-glucose 4-epimerase